MKQLSVLVLVVVLLVMLVVFVMLVLLVMFVVLVLLVLLVVLVLLVLLLLLVVGRKDKCDRWLCEKKTCVSLEYIVSTKHLLRRRQADKFKT